MQSIKELQNFTFVSKYARWLPEKSRRETWKEAVDRVRQMMLEKYKDCGIEEEILWAYEMMEKKKVLGSQRGLQFGGEPIMRKNARLYNCSGSYCDRLRFFSEAMWLLLNGVGVGCSIQQHHVEKLPKFNIKLQKHIDKPIQEFVIPDSVEGWADSIQELLNSYFIYDYRIHFKFHKIRTKGSPLSSGVGTAPGPDGLEQTLKNIDALLLRCLQDGQKKLKPIDCLDIFCYSADAVVSGGVRRSAGIALFSVDDEEMMRSKTGNWFTENPQRARCNISATLLKNTTSFKQFTNIIQHTRQVGEPGFSWVDSEEVVFNPCFSGDTRIHTNKGLQKIKDLYQSSLHHNVSVDMRPETDGYIKYERFGVMSCNTSRVELTQKNAKVYRVTTKHGYFVDVTMNHLFPTNGGYKPLNELVIGDTILIQSAIGQFGIGGSYEDGIVDGIQTKEYDNNIPQNIWCANKQMISGYLHGILLNCGNICSQRNKTVCYIKQDKYSFLQELQVLLSNFGVVSELNTELNYLYVDDNNIHKLLSHLTLSNISTDTKSTEIYTTTITKIQFKQKEDVYCLNQPLTHSLIANGIVTGNCHEVAMYPVDITTGKSGWQVCNLTTINCSNLKDKEDFLERCKAATILGSIQAGFTNFDYLGKTSENIIRREALLGVSMTGNMEKPEIVLDVNIQKEGASYVKKINKEMAKRIGINQAARTTLQKPEGCVHLNTIIPTKNGILQLGEIGNTNGNQWQQHSLLAMDDKLQYNNSTRFYLNGISRTRKIILSSHLDVEATLQHKFKVVQNDGTIIWKQTQDLQIDDKLAYVLGGYEGGNSQKLDINYTRLKLSLHDARNIRQSSKTKKELAIQYGVRTETIRSILNNQSIPELVYPHCLTEELAWFLGLYFGDGSNHSKSTRISGDNRKTENLQKAIDIIQKYFNYTGSITNHSNCKKDPNDHRCQCNLSSLSMRNWININGFRKPKSHDMEIPLSIRQEPKNILNAFIEGYISADGCRPKNGYVTICSTSKKMAQQLCIILRLLGKAATIYKQPPTATSYGTNMKYIVTILKGKTVNNNMHGDKEKNKLYKILSEHIYYDTITDIQDGQCLTADLHVDNKEHTYIANGFISHNTSSCLLGTSSGLHMHHAKRYIRHVQVNKTEQPYQLFKQINPQAVEESVWSAINADDVIKFPIEVPDGAKLKNQIPALEFLKIIKDTQQNWIAYGKNKELCTLPSLNHSVSNTVVVQDHEWDEVTKYIYDNRKHFAGVTLISDSGDKDYVQAPFVAVLLSHEIVSKYGDGSIWCSGLIELALQAFGNGQTSSASVWKACDVLLDDNFEDTVSEKLSIKKRGRISEELKRLGLQSDFWERGRNFALKYFDNDIKKLTYCIKDVYTWKNYYDLKKSFKPVDYTQAFEDQDNTHFEAESACSAAGCELTRI